MHDEESFDKLVEQFERKKDKKMDITEEGLMGAGLAMLGMALRAVAYGAAEGLAEWGEVETVEPVEDKLFEFIEDPLWHEEARFAACNALAWIGNDKTMKKVAEKVAKFAADKDPKQQLIGACYAQTLARRPTPRSCPMLVDLLAARAWRSTCATRSATRSAWPGCRQARPPSRSCSRSSRIPRCATEPPSR